MAADRGRDLKFSLLSDLDRFDVDEAARQLDDVGDAAKDAGRRLEDLDDGARTAGRALDDRLGGDAKSAARKVDGAFDAIARSARTSADKVDRETRDMRDSLGEVADEGRDTAREMAASFSEGGDIGDALQELAANAGNVLGPIGAAGGILGGVFIGLFRAQLEQLKADASDLFDAMIEDGTTKLSQAAVAARIQQAASEDPVSFAKEAQRIEDTIDAYRLQGVAVEDIIRAKAGDVEATDRVTAALEANRRRLQATTDAAGNYVDGNENARAAVDLLKREVNENAEAWRVAAAAVDVTRRSTDTTTSSVDKVRDAWGKARAAMGDPITAEVDLRAPTPAQLRMLRAGIQAGLGTIVVPVKPGQSKYANTADNSRYRD